MTNDPEQRKENRVDVTFWCVILGINTYCGISAYFHNNIAGIVISAVMIGWSWKRIWAIYDQSRGVEDEKEI